MDYKKAYKEAIESIKRIHSQADSYSKELMEKEFPKLHELSETEIIENLYRLLCAEVSIGTFEKYGLTDDAVFSWLKKLGELKSAEWSEEDERILARLIYVFNSYKNSDYRINIDKWEGLEINSILYFLKCIKSKHWKPSEEQMGALKKRTHGLHTSSETRKVLESLIDDLEKL